VRRITLVASLVVVVAVVLSRAPCVCMGKLKLFFLSSRRQAASSRQQHIVACIKSLSRALSLSLSFPKLIFHSLISHYSLMNFTFLISCSAPTTTSTVDAREEEYLMFLSFMLLARSPHTPTHTHFFPSFFLSFAHVVRTHTHTRT
jgi:hypothetical protein